MFFWNLPWPTISGTLLNTGSDLVARQTWILVTGSESNCTMLNKVSASVSDESEGRGSHESPSAFP